MPSVVTIRTALHEEHNNLVAIAKQHKHTRDFTNMIFSGKDCYEAGRIRVAESGGDIRAFTCFRDRIRDGWRVLYFIATDTECHCRGLGHALMQDLFSNSRTGVELKVVKTNPAVQFYEHLGYNAVEEAFHGTAWLMRLPKAQ